MGTRVTQKSSTRKRSEAKQTAPPQNAVKRMQSADRDYSVSKRTHKASGDADELKTPR